MSALRNRRRPRGIQTEIPPRRGLDFRSGGWRGRANARRPPWRAQPVADKVSPMKQHNSNSRAALRLFGGLVVAVCLLSDPLLARSDAVINSSAPAAPGAPAAHLIYRARWVRFPTAGSMAACYPRKAQRMSVPGFVAMQCDATTEGSLVNCRVVSEQPQGVGFGTQAVACLSPLFVLAPLDEDGVPVAGGTVRIGIKFALPNAAR
jgi:hypothetical protein